MERAKLLKRLRQIVGPERLLTEGAQREAYAWDASTWARLPKGVSATSPAFVVRPSSTQEVADILRLATETRTPVVPYGGGTGIMGGAVSISEGITIDLRGMDRVLRISQEDMAATVQPGVLLADLDKALRLHGLFLGHDPWSQPIATVGGAISTNGVGYMAAGFGPMGRQVLGIEAVLPTGEVVRAPAVPQVAGLDLKRLFIGGEGTFGVITEATLRVHPIPERRRHLSLEFPSFADGYAAILDFTRHGLRPTMVDFYEEDSDESHPITGEGAHPALLHLVLDGSRRLIGPIEEETRSLCGEHTGRDLGPGPANDFWRRRHESAERYQARRAAGERRPWRPGAHAFAYLHVALPVSAVLPLRAEGIRLYQEAGMTVRECAIWGQPELFSISASDPVGGEGSGERMQAVSDRVLTLAQEMGGSVEYCHGVGLRLRHLLPKELGEGGVALLRRLKEAMDPAGIMNPGKLLP
ncbi:MAG: FAD-binding oxidoreductase [Chloroflexi bacterium]|nr:FAD-binding oxidoreductase [Chloroflexota bacterium]